VLSMSLPKLDHVQGGPSSATTPSRRTGSSATLSNDAALRPNKGILADVTRITSAQSYACDHSTDATSGEWRGYENDERTLKTYGLGGGSFRIRSDCACRERTRLVLHQSPAGLSRDRAGHGGGGRALPLLLASAQRKLGV